MPWHVADKIEQVDSLDTVHEQFSMDKDGNWWTIISTGLDPHWFAERAEPTYQPTSALLPGVPSGDPVLAAAEAVDSLVDPRGTAIRRPGVHDAS